MLDITEIENMSHDQVRSRVLSSEEATINIPCRAIGSSISNLEVAEEYRQIAYVMDRLQCAAVLTDYNRSCGFSLTFSVNENDADEFVRMLKFVEPLVNYGIDPEVYADYSNFCAELYKYKTATPQAVESFYANYVTRGIYEEFVNDLKGIERAFEVHPEWRFSYWKSHKKGVVEGTLYYSQYNWVIRSTELEHIFSTIYGDVKFHQTDIRDGIAFNQYGAAIISNYPGETDAKVLMYALPGCKCALTGVKLSQNADVAVFDYGEYSVVSFDFLHPTDSELKILYAQLAAERESLSDLLDIRGQQTFDWGKIDDTQFEDLCREALDFDIRFKNARIEKMGKTRSRDGGRDFVIYTPADYNRESKKYIVQCKLIKNGKSLSKQRVHDILDVIGQYHADGYIIMTNEDIDATLYDYLNSIGGHADTSIRYDKTKLERFLVRFEEVCIKYFNQQKIVKS